MIFLKMNLTLFHLPRKSITSQFFILTCLICQEIKYLPLWFFFCPSQLSKDPLTKVSVFLNIRQRAWWEVLTKPLSVCSDAVTEFCC